ncbi:MAG: rhomboid family intramembrane serine protease [Chloroflexota bacterium]|nr:rhomboid family intramembrane serine protease [Chloroflexota bacterium]
MLPVRDLNPTKHVPYVTWGLIGINVLIFLWQLSLTETELLRQYVEWAVVPALASRAPFAPETLLDVVRSMFFHGGWDHILGNMLYLFLFGDNLEDRYGKVLYLVLYFVGGFVAAFAQVIIDPTSEIPLIGASGAIAAVLGAYLILFPRVQVLAVVPLGYVRSLQPMPAFIVLGLWFVLQLVQGFGSLGASTSYGGGVAFFAHIGGFVVGVILAFVFNAITKQPPPDQRQAWAENTASQSYQQRRMW